MPKPKHKSAKEHDRKWREKNKIKIKINNMESYGKIVKRRVEDPDLHAKMKADQAERKRKSRAKQKEAILANSSSSSDPPTAEPSPPACSSAPIEAPDVSPVPVPASEPSGSGRRTRAATPAQLQESDQEDAEAPSNKLVEGL